MKTKTELHFKADAKQLFEEIIECGGSMWIMDKPLRIVYKLMQDAAARAIEIQDEKMIAIMGALGMYDECRPKHPQHNKMNRLIRKYY